MSRDPRLPSVHQHKSIIFKRIIMQQDFILPDIGEGIVECEIVEWLVQEGESVQEDQNVVEVMTDKAVVQIPSKYTGKIVKHYHAQGEIAQVHTPLFVIKVEGDEASTTSEQAAPEQATPAAKQAAQATPAPIQETIPAPIQETTLQPVLGDSRKVLTTPAVRRIARENGVDLTQVPGTGKSGRVLKEDVQNFMKGGAPASAASSTAPIVSSKPAAEDRVEGLRGVMRNMAKNMASTVTIPLFTLSEEIDVTSLMSLKRELTPIAETEGVRLTLTALMVKALSLALYDYPIINSYFNYDKMELTYKGSHNIGIAAATPTGLMVPNIKNSQNLNLLETAQELNRVTGAAKEGKISPADLKDGTITISNIGMIGGTTATPILTPPQVAIVAIGKIQTLPRFNDAGEVVKQNIMHVSWTCDHRVVDGATIANLCVKWKSYLENPSSMLLKLA